MTERVSDERLATLVAAAAAGKAWRAYADINFPELGSILRELQSHRRTASAGGEGVEALSLKETVEKFADAADYNVTCFEAYGEGNVPASALALYELGKQARAIMEGKPVLTATAEGERMAEAAQNLVALFETPPLAGDPPTLDIGPILTAVEGLAAALTAFKAKGGGNG